MAQVWLSLLEVYLSQMMGVHGHVNITHSYKSEYPLICRSELPISGSGYWYLHPTQKSNANGFLLHLLTARGWNRTEDN